MASTVGPAASVGSDDPKSAPWLAAPLDPLLASVSVEKREVSKVRIVRSSSGFLLPEPEISVGGQ
jgi:hypothetical protein